MLSICDFNTFYSPSGGGVREYLERKYEFYRDRPDVRYCAVVPGPSSRERRDGSATWYTIRAFPVPGAPTYRWLPGVAELRQVLDAVRPHLVEVGAPYLSPFLIRAAARDLDTRLVGFWHADYPDTYVAPALHFLGGPAQELGRRLAWAYARLSFRGFDALMAASASVATKLERRGFGPVYRTPLGVDTDLFRPLVPVGEGRNRGIRSGIPTAPATGTNRAEELPDGERCSPVILYAGRLSPEKGVQTLLDAFPRVVAEFPGVRLQVAGHGPLEWRLEQLARNMPGIERLGFTASRQDHALRLAQADVAVVPGGHETFSLATLEALACGVPVVCADTGGAAELVLRSGAGRVFRTGDAGDLARHLVQLLSGSAGARKHLGHLGRDFAVQHHRWGQVLEHQLDCYREILSCSRRRRTRNC